jgi:hypothetical protein
MALTFHQSARADLTAVIVWRRVMQTVLNIWKVLVLLGVLGLPQLLGVLGYFRLRKYHDFLAHLVGFLIPPVLFFFIARALLFSSSQETQAQGERACGTYLGMMVIAILLGTGLQMGFSLIAQFTLHVRHRAGAVSS